VRRSRHIAPPELDRLELAVRRLREAHQAARSRAEQAEARVAELGGALRNVATGGLDPLELTRRVELLEDENRTLRERLTGAREAVQRITMRLQFAEEER
jgi:hypothetical protein